MLVIVASGGEPAKKLGTFTVQYSQIFKVASRKLTSMATDRDLVTD